MKSISEFTIVEAPAESPEGPRAGGTAAYEAPTVISGEGTAPEEATLSEDRAETAWGHDDAGAPSAGAAVAAAPSEADRLFDSPETEEESVEPAESIESEANDDVIATAFGGSTPVFGDSRHPEELPAGEPVFIGGDPSTRFAAESLEEIARGIRAGEILLPPIDPAADQPAVLAAVLAAILAPRR